MAAPVVKWAGGKRGLLPVLVEEATKTRFRGYHEPFCGGGALFFALQAAGFVTGATLVDANIELIGLYRAIRDETDALIRWLRVMAMRHNKAYYYHIRDMRPHGNVPRAARTLYLNRTCFNGLYRVNRGGDFNVPVGSYTNPKICDVDALHAAAAALQNTTLCGCDFGIVEASAQRGDLVYMDPPYDGVFASYTAAGFGSDDQRRVAAVFHRLVAAGVRVMVSNADTELIRDLYAGERICEVSSQRSVASGAKGRGRVNELLIIGDS